ncbi:hypothetical protein KM792_12360 [Clostridium tyrobutyricum]|uniref:hypothetical protein n=1 Tax=Clostridium tyrobutyricum TaxID=1519 RepID=UPI00073D849A|nr:hypothetical protein [Clostridium tyrobutyricum]MBV4450441.1 hypothetical protein [Clostridium tyrobutyricum]
MENLRYYEKEVLSVSTGRTIELTEKYNIYAFPNDNNHKYKKFIFITFRRNKNLKIGYIGGEMENLYKVVDDTLVLDPNDLEYKDRIKKEYNKYADRLLNYVQDRKDIDEFEKEGKFRFYILSETEQIRLDKKPVPIHGHGPGKIYYTLAEILSGRKKIRSENECKDNNI